ncbi:MAG: LysE family translocator [Paracoccaceae bacterium]
MTDEPHAAAGPMATPPHCICGRCRQGPVLRDPAAASYHGAMTPAEYTIALLALLASPGPTNTLLFVAGAERGLGRAAPLIALVIAAYMATVLPLALAGGALLDRWPMARPLLMLASAVWILVLAVRLWRTERPAPLRDQRHDGAQTAVTGIAVAVTTLLNPKALVIGFVLLPSAGITLAAAAVLGLISSGASLLWIAAGAVITRRTPATGGGVTVVRRVSALWLAVLATLLIARAATA